jgi:hypothetical protein
LIACAVIIFASGASAQTNRHLQFDVEIGDGDPTRARLDARDAIRAAPISQLGPDAFRYVQQPALGGRAYVILVRRRPRDAVIDISWLDGHPRIGWTRTRHKRMTISLDYYDGLSTWIDEEFDRAEQAHALRTDAHYVCTDGPGSSTERVNGGEVRWMSGFCGERHPNELIGARMRNLVLDLLGSH